MAAKKTTQTAKTARVKNAEFVIFDRTLQGAILVENIKSPILESGLIAEEHMAKLKAHDSTRNRSVQCVNAAAMSLWNPLKKSRNTVLTPEIIIHAFALHVEEGVPIPSLPFRLRDKFKVEITVEALKNALNGKTHKDVKVPRNLRQKYAKMVSETPTKMGKAGTPVETRVEIILKVMGGTSGGDVAKEHDLTSSTVNTMVRQFLGRYRDGKPVALDKLPSWVPKARVLLKEKLETGDYEIDAKFKNDLNFS